MAEREYEPRPSLFVPLLLSLIPLYILAAVAIYVDERVTKTYIVHSVTPDWVIDGLRIVFWPAIQFIRHVL